MENKPLTKLASEFPELYNWVKSISRCGKAEDFIIADYKENILRVKFYTQQNSYFLTVNLPEFSKNKKGYMMATFLTRKPRAGEDWCRGRDLADGDYSKETWQKIINAIIAYELVKAIKPRKLRENRTHTSCPENFKPITDGNGII